MSLYTKKKLINSIQDELKIYFKDESSGHDYWHAYRVWCNAKLILNNEPKADKLVVELAALLHDVADWKFNNGDEQTGLSKIAEILKKHNLSPQIIERVCSIATKISFK